MKAKITTLILAFLFVLSQNNFAQNASSLWTKVEKPTLTSKNEVRRVHYPKEAQFYNLDLNQLKTILATAPDRDIATGKSNLIVDFPTPETPVR